jgi:hypothetical protein
MSNGTFPLDVIPVASPCDVSWEAMPGDERTRHCPECQQRVYNLSALSRRQAEDLLRRTEGRLCVRLYRRADGTVLTADCPVGLRAVRRKLAGVVGAAATMALVLIGWASSIGSTARSQAAATPQSHLPQPVRAFLDWLYPVRTATMGKPCAPPPTAPPAGTGNPGGVNEPKLRSSSAPLDTTPARP